MATVKSGHLQKLSGFLKRDWKRRYFVLYQDGKLVYYERAGEEHSDGRLNIRHDCQRIDYGYEVERDTQQKASGSVNCLFSVRTTQKTVYLLADTEQDARDWVEKLNGIRQNAKPVGSYGAPGVNQPGMPYPASHTGMAYPNSQPGMPYPNGQSALPYQNQQGMPYPSNQPGMPYPPNQPPMPYPPQPAMPTYPPQPAPYNQPVTAPPYQAPPYSQYPNPPQNYPVQAPPRGGYAYPAYQQQQVVQGKKKNKTRRGLLAGAAGGALAGGLLGFGMGHAVGGFGDSFDSWDSDCSDCDFGDCD